MKVSIDDLKKRYGTLETNELIALKRKGGLTETARVVLEEELLKRKPTDEKTEEHIESEKHIEDDDTKNKKESRNWLIEVGITLALSSIFFGYDPMHIWSPTHTYEYYVEKSIELSKKGDYSQAMEVMLKAKEKAPNDYLVYHLLGITYVRLNQIDKAKKCFERVIELSPNLDSDADVCMATGGAYLWLGNSDKAEQLLKRAINLYEKNGKKQDAEKARQALMHIRKYSP